jgi:ankyrin repeat protein
MKLTYDGDLFDAIEFGDLESVKLYWQDSIEINYQEKGGNTMLMLAVHYGFEDIVKYYCQRNRI